MKAGWSGPYTLCVSGPTRHAPLTLLLENHRAFLRYLERRIGDKAVAEDLLQDAFVRALDKADAVSTEAVIPWFYRVLRNATVDYYRRHAVASRGMDALVREFEDAVVPPAELRDEICQCVVRLASTLKPEYAEALQAVDVRDTPVKEFAVSAGLTASNAGVRLHRARQALQRRVVESCGTCAEHGCLACSCGGIPSRPV